MILYELRCTDDHAFEAWFRDSATYDRQAAAGEISCPVCGDAEVAKAPMAPRISRTGGDAAAAPARMRKMLTELRETVERSSDYVGDRFAEEARRIHYGETEHRNIYGEASDDEARELIDEGLKIGRIPWLPRTDS